MRYLGVKRLLHALKERVWNGEEELGEYERIERKAESLPKKAKEEGIFVR